MIRGDSVDTMDGFIVFGSYNQESNLEIWRCNPAELVSPVNWSEALPSENPCHVNSAQLSKSRGKLFIAGGAEPNEVKVFDSFDFFIPIARIGGLSRACFTVEFSHKEDAFAIGGGDGVIRVFNLSEKPQVE